MQLDNIQTFFENLQLQIVAELSQIDGCSFNSESWNKDGRIDGITYVLENGNVFEKVGVGFSKLTGESLPPAASIRYPELVDSSYQAFGVSLIIHPRNPYIPTTHANFRFFIGYPKQGEPIWWFGGGYDLTPYYPFKEDCVHWHQTAKKVCDDFEPGFYEKLKKWCDEYFYLKHRQEARGIGGVFFDDLNCWDFATSFDFTQKIANSFLDAYLPIVLKRQNIAYGERERAFQLYRRGRYVEFNLLQDRGTLFGLQSNGRVESILMSLPPLVKWQYNYVPKINSPEAKLAEFLQPKAWAELTLNAVD